MKKILLQLFILFAVSITASAQNYSVCDYCEGHFSDGEGWECPHCKKGMVKSKGTARTIYYVVVASFKSLSEASQFCANGPYDTEWGCVYKKTEKGATSYLVCSDCFYNKAKADKAAKSATSALRDFGEKKQTAWVWASKGAANCVEPCLGNDGSYFVLFPE